MRRSSTGTPLLKDGRAAEARALWLRIAGFSSADAVFDGNFAGLPGSAPFGWRLHNEADIQIEINHAGAGIKASALKVASFGSLTILAAEQSLSLAPSAYQLNFRARGVDEDNAEQAFA